MASTELAEPRVQDGLAGGGEDFEKILYHITHDVRATLRALTTLPDWLREDLARDGVAVGTAVDENLQMMQTQARRADSMMSDLKTYAELAHPAGKSAAVALDGLVAEAARDAALPEGFVLETAFAVAALNAPPDRLRTVLTVLISNTVKHHDRDAGVIHVSSEIVPQGVRLRVEDDGPGIPEAHRERAFEMMSTLKPRDTCEGSGMGLPIARRIVGQIGGSMAAKDTGQPRGCRIDILLPLSLASPVTLA